MSSVCIMIPIKPQTSFLIWKQLMDSINALDVQGLERVQIVFHHELEPSQQDDYTPWSKVTRVRNRMLDQQRHRWETFDYILWIDADVFKFPSDLVKRLLAVDAGDKGITAPMVLIDGTEQFYDWSAFIQSGKSHIQPENRSNIQGRNLQPDPPYWQVNPFLNIVPMDCVGSCYLVHTDIYKSGVRHQDHPSFTDHFPICEAARRMHRHVVVVTDLVVYHAFLPQFGEEWH
jgi:hypothetical protein